MAASKTSNWAFIIYPESAPDGWQDLIADTHIAAFISPLHDRDTDDNGITKKPHYHVIIMTDGPITQKRANDIIAPFGGTQSAEYVQSLRGYVRYLAHLDERDPNKARYDPTEIIALNGADIENVLKCKPTDDRKQLVGEIMRFCEEHKVFEFSALVHFAVNEQKDWLPFIVSKAYFITRLLDSLRHSRR